MISMYSTELEAIRNSSINDKNSFYEAKLLSEIGAYGDAISCVQQVFDSKTIKDDYYMDILNFTLTLFESKSFEKFFELPEINQKRLADTNRYPENSILNLYISLLLTSKNAIIFDEGCITREDIKDFYSEASKDLPSRNVINKPGARTFSKYFIKFAEDSSSSSNSVSNFTNVLNTESWFDNQLLSCFYLMGIFYGEKYAIEIMDALIKTDITEDYDNLVDIFDNWDILRAYPLDWSLKMYEFSGQK